MRPNRSCPECGAEWSEKQTCQDYFHQMLFWENETPSYGEVHHLIVLCYHIQHPSQFSPEGLSEAIHLLVKFLEHGVTPQQALIISHTKVDSSRRTWKIKGRAASHGSYPGPIQWRTTIADW